MGVVREVRAMGGARLRLVLVCVLLVAKRTGVESAISEFSTCDRSTGLCNCKDGDQRCEVIKGFFEHSHEGCGAASGTRTCVHPDLVGYQSCEFARRISECRVSVCWAWTVSVMATCGGFFTDMQSSPLSVCNASLAGPNTGAYTLAVYQQQRTAAEEGREVDAPACTASHGQCTEHCATQFNLLWRDVECSTWLQDYADRSSDMAADLERWTAKCEQAKPPEGFNLMVPAVVTVVGAVMFGIVFYMYRTANGDADGASIEAQRERNKGLNEKLANQNFQNPLTQKDSDDSDESDDDDGNDDDE